MSPLESKTTLPNRHPDSKLPRSLHLALFAIGLLWVLASRVGADSAGQGIARLLHAEILKPTLSALFQCILLLTGFTALNWVAIRNGSFRSTNALPSRPTVLREWQLGAGLGWALLLAALLPMVLTGRLHPQFWWAPRAWGFTALSLLALLFGSLATEIAFRGFLFRNLIGGTGPVSATLLLSVVYALSATSSGNSAPFSFLVALFLGFLLAMAYLRTHALWVGWGFRFAWLASIGVLFGLPLSGSLDYAGVITTDTAGPAWLSGGSYGPEGAFFTSVALAIGLVLLYRFTRDYAWEYTHPAILAGGYPMDVPPPAAHTAIQSGTAPSASPLVQIAAVTPTTAVAARRPEPVREGEVSGPASTLEP